MREMAASVTKNAAVMFGSQLVTWASTFLLMIILPRYLGSQEYGRLYLAMSLAMMAQVFVEFGGSFFVAKEVARDHAGAGSLVANSIGLRLVLSLISIGVFLAFAALAGYPGEVITLIAILIAAKTWEGALAVLVAAFQGFERMGFRSVTAIIERVALSILAVIAVLVGGRSVAIACLMAFSTLLSTLIGFRLLQRIIPRLPAIDWKSAWTLVRKGIPYLMMSIFAVIYFRVSTVMLSFQTSDQVLGWFGAAFRFFDILMFLPSIVSMALFPVLSRLAGDRGSIAQATQKGVEVMLIAAMPVCVATFAFAGDIIRILFGAEEFIGSVTVLRVLAFGIPVIYVNFILVSTLMALDRQKVWSFVALGAVPVNIGLNALFIPLYQASNGNGGIGSALATDVTELGILISALALMPRNVLAGELPSKIWKTLLASSAMALVLWLMSTLHFSWYLQAAGSIPVYVAMMVGIGGISADDLALLRPILSPRGLRQMFIQRGRPVL